MKIQQFISKWQGLILATLCSVALLELRMFKTGSLNYAFLLWNLFLGYIPLAISEYLILQNQVSKWKLAICSFVWLLFFPNAPYIITDLMHLNKYEKVPWLDGLMLFSFAITSLAAGLLSFIQIKQVLKAYLPVLLYRLFTVCIMLLAGFGVYLGRFERWNSWDIVSHPFSLLYNSVYNLQNPRAIAVTLAFACCLFAILQLFIQISTTIHDTDKKVR